MSASQNHLTGGLRRSAPSSTISSNPPSKSAIDPEVDSPGMCQDPVEKPFTQILPVSESDSERGFSAIDKVEADMTFRRSLLEPVRASSMA